jgi:hypothetical protein
MLFLLISLRNPLYVSTRIIRIKKSRRLKWARIGEIRNAYNILGGKPEGKRPPRRLRRRWKDNINEILRK